MVDFGISSIPFDKNGSGLWISFSAEHMSFRLLCAKLNESDHHLPEESAGEASAAGVAGITHRFCCHAHQAVGKTRAG